MRQDPHPDLLEMDLREIAASRIAVMGTPRLSTPASPVIRKGSAGNGRFGPGHGLFLALGEVGPKPRRSRVPTAGKVRLHAADSLNETQPVHPRVDLNVDGGPARDAGPLFVRNWPAPNRPGVPD